MLDVGVRCPSTKNRKSEPRRLRKRKWRKPLSWRGGEGGELKIAATFPFTRFREKVKPPRKQRYNRQAEKRVAPDE